CFDSADSARTVESFPEALPHSCESPLFRLECGLKPCGKFRQPATVNQAELCMFTRSNPISLANQRSLFDRRQFLQTAAALTVSGIASPGLASFRAAPIMRETEHFWCRLAPEGPYIDSQRDHKA